MLKIEKKTFIIWSIVLIGLFAVFSYIYKDAYLRIYWSIFIVFLSWSILSIREKIVNTLIIFSVFYAVLFAFGPMLLYKQGYDYYVKVGNYILISYLCFAIGYTINNKKTHRPRRFFTPVKNSKVIIQISTLVFLVGAISYSLYFIRNWRNIFITDLESGRVNAMTGNGIFLWLGSLVWLAVYMVYEQTLITNKYKKYCAVMFVVSAFLSILLGFRSALVNPILVIFFMKNKQKEIPVRRMIALVIVLFIFVGVYGAIRGGGGSTVDSLLNEFKVSSVNLNNIMETFPKRIPYQFGYTYLLDFLTLVDNNVDGMTMWLKKALRLSFSGGGVTPTIIGEFYINWGFAGVLIGMILIGVLFKRVEREYRNPHNSIFLSCLILGYIRPIIRGGISNSAVTLLVYIIGYCGCQLVAKKLRFRNKNHGALENKGEGL